MDDHNDLGSDLRRWAMQCAARAQTCKLPTDRDRLMAMSEALLHLAENEDWLAGRKSAEAASQICESHVAS